MSRADSARLFVNGGSQAVRLPREFRFDGGRVRVRRTAQGVLLRPMFEHAGEWLLHLDEVKAELAKNSRKTVAKSSRQSPEAKPAASPASRK